MGQTESKPEHIQQICFYLLSLQKELLVAYCFVILQYATLLE